MLPGAVDLPNREVSAAVPSVDALIQEARARARRRRRRVGAALGAAMLLLAVIIGYAITRTGTTGPSVRNSHAGGGLKTAPIRYTAVGPIIADPAHNQPAQVCAGVALSLPPGCGGGVTLANLDLQHAPTVRTVSGVTFTRPLRVVGTYANGVLTLTEPPKVDPNPPAEDPAPNELPCPTPTGGWADQPSAGLSAAEFDQYGQEHPSTFGGFWVADKERVAVVSVTRNIAKATRELRGFYPGNLCVTTAVHPLMQLRRIADQFMPLATSKLRVFSTGVDVVSNTVDVGLIINDDNSDRYIRRLPQGTVRTHPFLTPIK